MASTRTSNFAGALLAAGYARRTPQRYCRISLFMKKFPASIPRKMFTKSEVGNSDFCPVCGARLENENHTYLIVVKSKNDFDSFVMGNDFGYFCLNCPVVVVDYDSFSDLLIAANKVNPI